MNHVIVLFSILEIMTLVLLLVLSIWSVGIMIDRKRALQGALRPKELQEMESLLDKADIRQVDAWLVGKTGVLPALLMAMRRVPQKAQNIEAAAKSSLENSRQKLEQGLGILATLGSNAPFIGLFGTVLGIIEAFSALSTDQAGSAKVMSSISEALIATAAGLFVAIPAVVAYNFFSGKLRRILSSGHQIKDLYLSKLSSPE